MDDVKYKELISVTDQMIFKEICSMLDEKQIPYLTDDDGDFATNIRIFNFWTNNLCIRKRLWKSKRNTGIL